MVTEILNDAQLERKGPFLYESTTTKYHLVMKDMANVIMIILVSKHYEGKFNPSMVKTLKELREKVPVIVK